MKKKLMGVLMGATLAFGLAACGGGDDAAEKDNNNNNATGGETTSANGDAEALVKKNCITCHGENLEGRNGPALAEIGSKLSKDEILEVIHEGRPGMPANLVQGDDADKVAAWLAEKK